MTNIPPIQKVIRTSHINVTLRPGTERLASALTRLLKPSQDQSAAQGEQIDCSNEKWRNDSNDPGLLDKSQATVRPSVRPACEEEENGARKPSAQILRANDPEDQFRSRPHHRRTEGHQEKSPRTRKETNAYEKGPPWAFEAPRRATQRVSDQIRTFEGGGQDEYPNTPGDEGVSLNDWFKPSDEEFEAAFLVHDLRR